MATVTVEDVAKGVRARWAATASLNALVPVANVWAGRAESTAAPYAVIGVAAGQEQRASGDKYLQRFGVAVACYVALAAPNADAVLSALTAAFAGKKGDTAAGLVVPNAVAVVHCRSVPGSEVKVTGQKNKDGANVVRVAFPIEILLQGIRG